MAHKIDIIIPCYNYGHFLDDCLSAVTSQTRGDFSVLLMDNASTDDTAEKAAAWMQRDTRIRYQRNDSNIGAVNNFQRGYELTQADYVVILPADDLWQPEFLAATCDALDQHPHCAYAWSGWGTCRQPDDFMGQMTTVPHEESGPVDDMPFLTLQNYIPLSFGVFRRSACDQAGGLYPRFLPMLGDLYLWMRLSAVGQGYFVNRQLGRLRMHGSNATHELHTTGRSAYDWIYILDLVFASERWPKPIRLLAKARQIQLLTGEKISAAVRAFGNDKTLPIIQDYIKADRLDLYLIAALAIRGYPEAVQLNDTASDVDDLLAEVIDQAPKDSAFNLLGQAGGQSEAMARRRLNKSYETWQNKRSFIAGDIKIIEQDMARWKSQPAFQILLRLDESARARLADTLESLNRQFYGNWRIDIVTSVSPPAGIEAVANLGWHSVENAADGGQYKAQLDLLVAARRCDWIIELPAGAVLDPLCLWRIASESESENNRDRDREVDTTRSATAFYVDDDVISSSGDRTAPRFKGELDGEWCRSADLIGPLFVRRQALRAAGGVSASNESPWYDLLLRLLEAGDASAIRAIPDVLLSYRDAFPTSQPACMTTLAEHLTRLQEDCDVAPTSPDTWRVIHYRRAEPLVSLLIPSGNALEFIAPGINSILEKTAYDHYELIVVADADAADPELRQWLNELSRRGDRPIQVIAPTHSAPNRAAALNQAARAARGDYLVLLSEDTRILQERWLDELLAQGQRPGIGAVTPRQVQPQSGLLENAGYTLGIDGLAGAPGRGSEKLASAGYLNRLQVCREISAAPTSCLLVSRADYLAVGGLDETLLADLAADIDFSLKLRDLGRRLIYTPFATVVHYGNIAERDFSFNPVAIAEKLLAETRSKQTVQHRWRAHLAHDRRWSPNLSLETEAVAIETRHLPTWRYLPGRVPRILTRYVPNGQGLYRIEQPLRAARMAGLVQECNTPQVNECYNPVELARCGADSLIAQLFLHDGRLLELQAYRRFAPDAFIIYSCDDLLTDMPLKSVFRKNVPADARRRYQAGLRHCDRLVVSTPYLAETSRHFIDDIRVVPNRLVREFWMNLNPSRRTSKRPRIGWAGGTGHQGDLELIKPVIEATRHEADWIFFGMCPAEIRPLLAEYHELVGYDAYPQKLASLDLDIAVAPLEDIPFNYGKSNLRLLEYGALGLPVVCSDVLPYRDSPATRVANDPALWIAALRERIHDLDAALREGARLRAWVERHYVLEDHIDEWLAAHLP
ncbi:MAG: glycosyltransferase [Desulfobulbus sp.]|nr:glycosyltransferase [Desulfobulbus sp.]